MDFGDIFGANPTVIDLQAANRWEAIDELIHHLVVARKINADHKEAITAAVKKREAAMSTGIGFGIGLPHATTNLVGDGVGAIGHSDRGIEFEALDGGPVKVVVLFLIPPGQFQKHAHTLANIAKWARRRFP
jgi:mannitol/fructose-specific phosphotransferase system IIA component (Ntr-type)